MYAGRELNWVEVGGPIFQNESHMRRIRAVTY